MEELEELVVAEGEVVGCGSYALSIVLKMSTVVEVEAAVALRPSGLSCSCLVLF